MQTLQEIRQQRADREWAAELRQMRLEDIEFERQEKMDLEMESARAAERLANSIADGIVNVTKGAVIGYMFIILTPIAIFAYLVGVKWFVDHGIVIPQQYVSHIMTAAYAFLFYAIADIFGKYGRAVWWILVALFLIGSIT